MALVQLCNIHLAYGADPLLDGVDFRLEAGERVCLIGRNGEGKSSLMKIVAKKIAPDDGEVIYSGEVRIGMLNQEVPNQSDAAIDVVMAGNPSVFALWRQYHAAANACAMGDTAACALMNQAQHALDDAGGWDLQRQAAALIDAMDLDKDQDLQSLSGGRKRRVMLAQALISRPDALLLDEPTNHLDIESIAWLEDFLIKQKAALLFVSHDRRFVDKVATRIVELDRGKLTSYDVSQGVGGFARYQELKAYALQSEQKNAELFDKKLAQEEAWIRQGIKARRARNEGRVRALKQLRIERAARRERIGNARFEQNFGEKSGKLVCQIDNLRLEYDNKVLVSDFSARLLRGDKVGVIGKNGVGKTTLIKTLLGLDNRAKTDGKIKLGAGVRVAFFDQLKDALDPTKSVADNVSEGSDYVEINGNRRHILGYLQDFLFTPKRAKTPLSALSGGEKARVLLAKLLLLPANVLVLDEPTNDLDIETLELLEEFVGAFEGVVLLISHDRDFMDNVVTQTWVFETNAKGEGVVREYVGGYDDYLAQSGRQTPPGNKNDKKDTKSTTPQKPSCAPKTPPKTKLSYKHRLELEQLPAQIEALEKEQTALQEQLADGSWFGRDFEAANAAALRLNAIDELILQKMARWEELESLS